MAAPRQEPRLPPFDMSKPLLVFGGPYSNREATQAMGQRAEALSIPPRNVICTGDVVAQRVRARTLRIAPPARALLKGAVKASA